MALSKISRCTDYDDGNSLHLFPRDFADDNDSEKAGIAIMNNTCIQELHLKDFREASTSKTKYQPLFQGISQNNSIQSIYIQNTDVHEELSSVIFSKSITSLWFCDCDITVDIFAVISQREKSLLELNFVECTFKEEIRSTKRANLESSDRGVNVVSFGIAISRLGKQGWDAVSRSLLISNATLKAISIKYSNREERDHEWSHSFFDGLKGCQSLEKLEYGQQLGSGPLAVEQTLTRLASALPCLKLRELDLSNNDINNDVARALSHGISQNKTLEIIRLNSIDATEEALSMMIRACLCSTSSLHTLQLWRNHNITDYVILSLVEALTNNSTLEELDLTSCYAVTSSGWLALSPLLGRSSSLYELNLSESTIDDTVITAFVNELRSNGTLERLFLRRCEYVTSTGWITLSPLLGSPNSALRELDVCENNIDDDVVVAFFNEISGNDNSKLKRLGIRDPLSITDVVETPIRNLLCNTSSIDATWSSNHNLYYLGVIRSEESDQDNEDGDNREDEIADEIIGLLTMNEDEDKKQVARKKVIKHHFSGYFDVNTLIGSNQTLLPRKISWFGRDSLGQSVVYSIIRTLPELCQHDHR